jgi:glutaredoxin
MKTDKFVILTKPECHWCDKAKAALQQAEIPYFELNIYEKTDLQVFMIQSGLVTVPQVYRNGHRIGGYEALEDFLLATGGAFA